MEKKGSQMFEHLLFLHIWIFFLEILLFWFDDVFYKMALTPLTYLFLIQRLNLLSTEIWVRVPYPCQQKSLSEPHYVTVRQRVTNKALAKREADTSWRNARFCSSTHLKRVYFKLVDASLFQQRQQTLQAFCEALKRWQKATGTLWLCWGRRGCRLPRPNPSRLAWSPRLFGVRFGAIALLGSP